MKRKKSSFCRAGALAIAIAILLCASPQARASHKPKPYALISGTVWAPDDTPMPGVKVMIRRSDAKKAKWKVISNREGEFDQRVPAEDAQYILTCEPVSLKGGGKLTAPAVTVHVYGDEREDTGLHLKVDSSH